MTSTHHATVASQRRKIPLKYFFKKPERTAYQISPDGKHIAFLKPYKRRQNIYVQRLGSTRAVRLTNELERDIAGFFWKGNHTLLYLRDFGGDENFHLFAVNMPQKQVRDLTPFSGTRTMLIDELIDSDDHVLIALNFRTPEVFDAYRLNVHTGELVLLVENPGNITSWNTDHDGKIRLAVSTDGVNTTLLYRKTEADAFKPILTTNFKESLVPLFFTFDNARIYAASNLGRDKSAIVIFNPETGKEDELLFQHPEVDVYDLSYSHKRKVLTAISFTTWKREHVFLDKLTEQIFSSLQRQLPDVEIALTSETKNEDVFIVRTYSDRSLGAYYLYELATDSLTKLADVSPWLKEDELCEMKPISYTSRDGLTIHGYLTLPKDVEPKQLPVIVNPHGGPWARDVWGFNPEVQFLANRGYAVLQMNFRGSTGYGRRFWEISFKKWGKEMQDDISDGVKWLIEQGIADPKRIGIYGGSYGGYAVLAGLAFTPDLYACGVDYVGVSNLFTFMKTVPPYWKPYLEMMYEMVGNPDMDQDLMRSASPVFHVDRIKAPLFVAQGAKDPRVNIEESNQIVHALRARGIDVPYLVKENEGHGFRNEENQFEFYRAMEKFLHKHLLKKK
ncbi:MAG: S9 family peptidase [[Chlorobium] sp. 445]|nr:MAG: S9 family peptidase [[Chlorobium] sp. 445]